MTSQYPKHVNECIQELEKSEDTARLALLHKLAPKYGDANFLSCKKMWKSLESISASKDDTIWVHAFLGNVEDAQSLPPYYYENKKYRDNLLETVNKHTDALINVIEKEKLEAHLYYDTSIMFGPGYYCYEDLSDSSRRDIDDTGVLKIAFSRFLDGIRDRISMEVNKAQDGTKASKNIEAIRFVRILSEQLKRKYKKPLLSVIATATNVLYESDYSKSDISPLINYAGVGKVEQN